MHHNLGNALPGRLSAVEKPKTKANSQPPFWDNARKGSSSKKLCLFTAGSYGFTGASKVLKAALWGAGFR